MLFPSSISTWNQALIGDDEPDFKGLPDDKPEPDTLHLYEFKSKFLNNV